jgi:hypothetical protein
MVGFGDAFSGGMKCNPKPTIDLDKSGAASMTVEALAWSITKSYADTDASSMPGKPTWYCSLRSGATPKASKALERKPDNLEVKFAQKSGATHAVQFIVAGANPLLTVAPTIDAVITVGLRKAGGGIEYAVKGDHDGFPNYTLTIDGRTVYAWDCVEKGESPLALAAPMDQAVDIGWQKL